MTLLRDKVGICQWFHYEDFHGVERAVELLSELGVRHVRTGISWADWHRPRGREWYAWQFEQLSRFELLISVWHTPPSIAEGTCCNGPPRNLDDYAGFLWQLNHDYGDALQDIELWNEPNNRYKWDFSRFDPHWEKFGRMINPAAAQAKRDGKRTVLGGMIPVDRQWLQLIAGYGALDHIDIVAIHGFPEMWGKDGPNWDWHSHWKGWPEKVHSIAPECGGRPVWITETGLATWNLATERPDRFTLQTICLEQAVHAPVERIYWYSLIDLDPSREAIEGFHVDENEYHLGLVTFEGEKKEAYHRFHELLRQPVVLN